MKIIIFILFNIVSIISYAADIHTDFASIQQQAQFNQLARQLRCLVCQNQSLLDSNAPLAADLRQQIATQIKAGYSNKQIIEYLRKRYGDYINYNPPFNKITFLLWSSPVLILILLCIRLITARIPSRSR